MRPKTTSELMEYEKRYIIILINLFISNDVYVCLIYLHAFDVNKLNIKTPVFALIVKNKFTNAKSTVLFQHNHHIRY